MPENKNIVTYKNAIEEIESYEMYYKCPNCQTGCLIKRFKFCPECGTKLQWDLKKPEELVTEIKEEIKKKGEGYIFKWDNDEYIIKNNEIFETSDDSIFLYNHLCHNSEESIVELYNFLKCLKG